jgi:hypothetical protein
MPGLTSTTYGSGDQRWLRSAHGLRDALSGYVLLSHFDESEHYPDGYIPSGTAVNAAVENDLKPYTGAEGERLGFLVSDSQAPVGSDPGFTAAYLPHGTVNVNYLPAPLPEGTVGREHFIFVGGNE